MKRVLTVAVVGGFFLASVGAQAQRGGMGGGGHVSGGGRGGGVSAPHPAMGSMGGARVGGGFGPRVGAPVGVGPMRVGTPAGIGPVRVGAPARIGSPIRTGVSGVVGRTRGVATVSPNSHVIFFNRFPIRHFHNGHVFFNSCFGAFPCTNPFFFNSFGFGTGFGFGFGGPFVPFYYPDYSYYPPYPESYYPPSAPASTDNVSSTDVQLAMEIQKLTDEIEDLKSQQSRSANPPPGPQPGQQPSTATTFVFRDGHRISATNYAIAGQTLWIFSENMAKKVSLDDLDRAATEQVNAANGIYLYLPKATQPR